MTYYVPSVRDVLFACFWLSVIDCLERLVSEMTCYVPSVRDVLFACFWLSVPVQSIAWKDSSLK